LQVEEGCWLKVYPGYLGEGRDEKIGRRKLGFPFRQIAWLNGEEESEICSESEYSGDINRMMAADLRTKQKM